MVYDKTSESNQGTCAQIFERVYHTKELASFYESYSFGHPNGCKTGGLMTTVKAAVFEKNYEIKYYEMNSISGVKESSFLLFMQDVATQSAEFMGFGPTFVFENNYAWYLLKYRIEFEKYPLGLDEIKMVTEPRGGVKLFAHRDFHFYAPDGELLGRANSIWALIDLGSKKMLPISAASPLFPTFSKRDDDLVFEKIPQMKSVTKKMQFDVSFDDIDINQHANNANYIRWALEPLEGDFRLNNVIKTMDMNFKKEIKFGEKVLSMYEFDPVQNSTNHIVKNAQTNDELCSIFIKWENNKHLIKQAKRK